MAFSAPAFAAPIVLTPGTSDSFSWSGGIGPINSPADGYQITVGGGGAIIDVVDCCIIGDRFEITFDDGTSPFTIPTSAIQAGDDGVSSGAFTIEQALADSRLSKAAVSLSTGTWDIDIEVVDLASGSTRGSKGGRQTSFWADVDTAPRAHMQKAFTQRRQQIVGDCHQLRLDVDHYNDLRPDEEPIQLILDFTEDVEELLTAEGVEDAA